MARYFWYRSKFFVHVFQQMGYKHNEYWQWLREHWEQKVIPGDLAFFNIMLFVIVVGFQWLDIEVTNTAVTVVLFIWAFFWFGSTKKIPAGKGEETPGGHQPGKTIISPLHSFSDLLSLIFYVLVVYRNDSLSLGGVSGL